MSRSASPTSSVRTQSRLLVSVSIVAMSSIYLGTARAQDAAISEPNAQPTVEAGAAVPDAVPLPSVVVSTNKSKKPAKKHKKKITQSAEVAGTASANISGNNGNETRGVTAVGGTTPPGLNLETTSPSGSRLGLTPLETPASVEVISGQTIRERGQTSVVDAVTQNAAGFTSVAAAGNGGSGLATRGFSGNGSVMQLYDGTRMYVGFGTSSFPFNTWTADRIEVVRGPASVLYGEGAIGGIINVIPKKPTDTYVHEGEVAVGTDFMRRFGVGSGGPITSALSYRVDIAGSQTDGWLKQEGEFKDLAFSGALKLKAAPGLTFTVSNDYGYQEPMRYFGTPFINGRIDDRVRFNNYNVSDSDIYYRDNWTQFKTEWRPTEGLTLRNTAYRLTTHRRWKDAENYTYLTSSTAANATDALHLGDIKRTSYLEIYHDQEQIGDRFDATLEHRLFGMRNRAVAGFDVNHIDFLRRRNAANSGTTYLDPYNFSGGSFFDPPQVKAAVPEYQSTTDQYSIFAEDRLELTDQVAVIGGLRYERPTIERENLIAGGTLTRDYSALTWRVGAVYTPVQGFAIYGQYATAIDPLSSLITFSDAQAPFDLTTGRQIEVGVKQEFWQGRGEWTFAAYDIVKNNLLTQDPNNPLVTQQIGQQSSRGLELSVAAQLTETLRAEGNVAVLQAQYDEFWIGGVSYAGKVPTNVPEQVANLWLKWNFAPRWDVYGGVRWVGQTFNDQANLSARPDYWLFNAGIDYAVTDNSVLSIRGFNLTDELYATSAGTNSDGSTRSWVLGRPRSAEVAYRIKF